MAASSRNTLKALYQALKKEYKTDAQALPKDREVLEYLIYAAFLENSPFETASKAFNIIEDYFIDWNELRVSTTSELVEILGILPFPQRTCERIRQLLQHIFQSTYRFDLEEWRKKSVEDFHAYLAGIPFVTRFMSDLVLRDLFQKNVFPFEEGSLRIMRLLDLVDINEENKEVVKSVEKTFSRPDTEEFFLLLHQAAAEIMLDPDSKKLMKILKSIDPEVVYRSYIPLVESIDEQDPSQIAKSLASKKPRHPARFDELDEAEFEDSMDNDFMSESEDSLSEGLEEDSEQNPFSVNMNKSEIREEVPDHSEKVSKTRGKKAEKKEKKVEKSVSAVPENTDTEKKSKTKEKKTKVSETSTPAREKKTTAVPEETSTPSKEKSKKKKALDFSLFDAPIEEKAEEEQKTTSKSRKREKVEENKSNSKSSKTSGASAEKPAPKKKKTDSSKEKQPKGADAGINIIQKNKTDKEDELASEKKVSKTQKLKQKKPR